jgi:thiol:disulfide interchange protein DsbC
MPKVTVFSDFPLRLLPRAAPDPQGHGRARHRAADLDPRHAGDFESVICAEDKAAAVERAYGDQDLAKRACDTSGLDANEAFARAHGFTGTPVLVREDGAVLLGFRPREFLESWLKGGA